MFYFNFDCKFSWPTRQGKNALRCGFMSLLSNILNATFMLNNYEWIYMKRRLVGIRSFLKRLLSQISVKEIFAILLIYFYARSRGLIGISFFIFFEIGVCCVLSLEWPHRQYTQYTIFNINTKSILNYLKSAAMRFFPMGLNNEFETAVVNEPLKFYCILG